MVVMTSQVNLLNPPEKYTYDNLKLIPPPQTYLQVELKQNSCNNHQRSTVPPEREYPQQAQEPKLHTIVAAEKLTSEQSDKTVLKLTLEYEDAIEPGDTIGIICPSADRDVSLLVERMDLKDQLHCICHVNLNPDANKRYKLPAYLLIPRCLDQILRWQLDLRAPVKKLWIRGLADYTSSPEEKQRLYELSSRQGSEEYNRLVVEAGLNIVDVLLALPSVQLPLARLFEWLPALQPRPYSVASSYLIQSKSVDIVFRVLEFPRQLSRRYDRRGVCTGFLDELTARILDNTCVTEAMKNLSIDPSSLPPQVLCYKRKGGKFRLPEDLEVPLILVAHGTGIAPFRGFLQHRQALKKQKPDAVLGAVTLFFGCRRQDEDFLFRQELERWRCTGLLEQLVVAFSRDVENRGYVQDVLREHGKEVYNKLDECVIYVCGDARHMLKSVHDTFIEIARLHGDMAQEEAESLFMHKKEKSEYVEDNWL